MRPWIWLVLTPLTSWIAFLAWGSQAQRLRWTIASGVYLSSTVGGLVLNTIAHDEGPLSELAGIVMLAAWMLAGLHACVIWRHSLGLITRP